MKGSESYEVIVIGAGIAGLAAAALLSSRGYSTCLLEKEDTVGGSLYTLERSGHLLQGGPHHIGGMGDGELVHSLLSELGLYDPELFLQSPPLQARIGDDQISVPFVLEELHRELQAAFPGESPRLSDFFRELTQFRAALNSNDRELILGYFQRWSRMTYAQYLRSFFDHPEIHVYLSVLGPAYGAITPEGNAFTMLSMMATYGSGAYYVKGGMHRLAELLHQSILKHGGTVLTGTRMEYAGMEGRTLSSVFARKDGQLLQLSGSMFISAGNFLPLYQELKSGLNNRRLDTKIASMTPGPAALRLFMCLPPSGRVPGSSDYIVLPSWRTEDWPAAMFYNSKTAAEGDQSISMISFPTTVDDALSPTGEHHLLMTVLTLPVQTGQGGQEAREANKAILTGTLQRQFPDLQLDLQQSWLITPGDLERRTGGSGGSVFGWRRGGRDVIHANVIGPRSFLDNLYVAGNWGPSFGLFGSLYSAAEVARLITEREPRAMLHQ